MSTRTTTLNIVSSFYTFICWHIFSITTTATNIISKRCCVCVYASARCTAGMTMRRHFSDSNFLCSSAPNVSNNKRLLVIVRVIVAGIRYTYWMSVSSTWTSVLLPVIRAWTPTAYMFVTAFITIIINWMRMCSITSCGTVMTMDRKLPDSKLGSSTPDIARYVRLYIIMGSVTACVGDTYWMRMCACWLCITLIRRSTAGIKSNSPTAAPSGITFNCMWMASRRWYSTSMAMLCHFSDSL